MGLCKGYWVLSAFNNREIINIFPLSFPRDCCIEASYFITIINLLEPLNERAVISAMDFRAARHGARPPAPRTDRD